MFRHVWELTLKIMVNSHSLACRVSSEVWRSKAALAAVATGWWSSGSWRQGDLLTSVPWDKSLEERGLYPILDGIKMVNAQVSHPQNQKISIPMNKRSGDPSAKKMWTSSKLFQTRMTNARGLEHLPCKERPRKLGFFS